MTLEPCCVCDLPGIDGYMETCSVCGDIFHWVYCGDWYNSKAFKCDNCRSDTDVPPKEDVL